MTAPVIPINRGADARRWIDAADGDLDQAGRLWAADLQARAATGDELAELTLREAVIESLTVKIEAAIAGAKALGITDPDAITDLVVKLVAAQLSESVP